MNKLTSKIRLILDKNEYQGFYAWTVFFLIVGGIFLVVSSSNNQDFSRDSSLPTPSTSNNIVLNAGAGESVPIHATLSRKLKNGTILAKDSFWSENSFWSGEGTLEVSNGTVYDSVLKLVASKTGSLVYFVYISANNNYTIKNIPDGSYRVLFSSGVDWDGKMFTRNRSNKSFDDDFEYTTDVYSDDEYEHTKYTTYNLTLNPVVGGTAQTDNIDQSIFDAYQ